MKLFCGKIIEPTVEVPLGSIPTGLKAAGTHGVSPADASGPIDKPATDVCRVVPL